MKLVRPLQTLVGAGVLMTIVAAPAQAQDAKFEIGASLASLTFGVGEENNVTTFGIPSSGLAFVNPGVYASIFLGPRVAIEPQVGLFVVSSEGDSYHVVNIAGQFDYFLKGSAESSPYVFGSVGVLEGSGSGPNPVSAGVGVGYRTRVGNTLTFRFDGKFTHLSDDRGDAFAFTVSIGGLLGR